MLEVTWGENDVQWYGYQDWAGQCNEKGKTYRYVAFLEKDA